MNKKCFEDVDENECYALNIKDCEDCPFYKAETKKTNVKRIERSIRFYADELKRKKNERISATEK